MSLFARAAVLAVLLLPAGLWGFAPDSSADSWMAPQPMLASSPDGRWYVIVQPTKKYSVASFQLVRRAAGAAARVGPSSTERYRGGIKLLSPDKGDTVVAEGACHMPLELACLDGGSGFLLFETYGGLGGATVLQRRDAKGKVVWSRGLTDFYSPAMIRALFTRSVSSTWWYGGAWVDQAKDEIGIVTRTKTLPGLLRVRLSTGAHEKMPAAELLARLPLGTGAERVLALDTAAALEIPGLPAAARKAFADASAPPLARAHLAVYLRAQGDESGRDFLIAAAAPDAEVKLRRYAVAQLRSLLGAKALPLLKDAMLSEDGETRAAAEQGFRLLGAAAVDTLVEMLADSKAPDSYREGAILALWNMGAAAERALPALKKLVQGTDKPLAAAAANALKSIRAALSPGR